MRCTTCTIESHNTQGRKTILTYPALNSQSDALFSGLGEPTKTVRPGLRLTLWLPAVTNMVRIGTIASESVLFVPRAWSDKTKTSSSMMFP